MENIDWNDKEEILKAVNQNGRYLEYASNELKNDKEVVLVAVNKKGWALQYASNELQKDMDILKVYLDCKYNNKNNEFYKDRLNYYNIMIEQEYMIANAHINSINTKSKVVKF